MLIDIHIHLRKERLTTMPFRVDFCKADQMIEMLDDAGIDMAVVLPLVSPEIAYPLVTPEEVMDICRQHPKRFIPFAGIDPRMLRNTPHADFRPLLQGFKDDGFKGIGEYIPNLPFDDPRNLNVFHQVEEVGLPLTFHIATRLRNIYGCYDEIGLPRLEKVLKECPDLKFFGHSQAFWSEISADVTEANRGDYPTGKVTPGRVVELMRECPNLYGDLSAGSGHNAISRDPDFGCAFMEEFQDRLFFGTDVCAYKQDVPIVPFWRDVREKKLISMDAYEKLSWKNANRVLDLGLA